MQDLDRLPNVPSSRYQNSDVHDANIEDGNPANWIGKDFDDQVRLAFSSLAIFISLAICPNIKLCITSSI